MNEATSLSSSMTKVRTSELHPSERVVPILSQHGSASTRRGILGLALRLRYRGRLRLLRLRLAAREVPSFLARELVDALDRIAEAANLERVELRVHTAREVRDADALHKTLVARGVAIVSAPEDKPFGRAFSIKDPANNVINFYQLQH